MNASVCTVALRARATDEPRLPAQWSTLLLLARIAVASGRHSSSADVGGGLRDFVLSDMRCAGQALRLRYCVRAVLLDRITGPFGRV
jgi:hypothetical protein